MPWADIARTIHSHKDLVAAPFDIGGAIRPFEYAGEYLQRSNFIIIPTIQTFAIFYQIDISFQ